MREIKAKIKKKKKKRDLCSKYINKNIEKKRTNDIRKGENRD